jgi:AcrR family transcriptional regulator
MIHKLRVDKTIRSNNRFKQLFISIDARGSCRHDALHGIDRTQTASAVTRRSGGLKTVHGCEAADFAQRFAYYMLCSLVWFFAAMSERIDPSTTTTQFPSGTPTFAATSSSEEDDTRARLLAAAGPVFAKRGFDGVTVREIARAAKVNVASIGYHFGDKMGLYLEVVRGVRTRRECQMQLPDDHDLVPAARLRARIGLLLSRMLRDGDEGSWETQLVMGEMLRPTAALQEIIEQSFRPMFEQITQIVGTLGNDKLTEVDRQKIAFSAIGQCLYYRVAGHAVRALIPENIRQQHFDIDALADHITRVTVAAVMTDA